MKYKYFELYDAYVVSVMKNYAEYIIQLKEIREEMGAPIPDNMYFLGDFETDSVMFLQDTKGRVYTLDFHYMYSKPKKFADSFIEFMNKRIEHYDNMPVE